MADDPLTSYLADHLAGSVAATELVEREIERHRETALGAFLIEALEQIRNDQQILRGILEKRGEKESATKNLGGWLIEKIQRLKTGGDTSFDHMQSLELLVIGMHGRVLLWGALEQVAQHYPALQALDFAWLKRRAIEHHDRCDQFRIEAARAVFAESLDQTGAAPGATESRTA